jgi:uncharacterized membrane protein required for colicin V production
MTQISPFDLILAVILLIGVVIGRKRGMSEELLDVIAWICAVVACGFLYRPISNAFLSFASVPIIMADIVSYLLILAGVLFLFKMVKRAVGEKLVEGDAFGRFEYYLGMTAGAIRFFCITMVFLAILNAKYISPAQRAETAKMQQENFGTISFPTIASLQHGIFARSYSGKFIAKELKPLLIRPVAATSSSEGIGKRRERAVEETMK